MRGAGRAPKAGVRLGTSLTIDEVLYRHRDLHSSFVKEPTVGNPVLDSTPSGLSNSQALRFNSSSGLGS